MDAGSAEARKWPTVDVSPSGYSPLGNGNGSGSAPLGNASSVANALNAGPSTNGAERSKKTSPALRRGRGSLAALATAAAKPKKLTMLEKSKLDWNSHLASSASKEEVEELEQSRRDGAGYLDRVGFLQRVDERKEDARSVGKRRR